MSDPTAQPSQSLAAYARRRGCSRAAVTRALRSGRLQAAVVVVDGRPTIPDFDRADVEWEENSDYSRQPARIDAAGLASDDGGDEEGSPYAGAAAREKHWKAQLAELNYQQRSGELVNAAEMTAAIAQAYTTVRSKLLGLPSKAKQALPHLTLADLATLDEIVREALDALATEAA